MQNNLSMYLIKDMLFSCIIHSNTDFNVQGKKWKWKAQKCLNVHVQKRMLTVSQKKQKTQVWADYSLHHIFKIKFYTHFSNIYKSININSKIRSCLHASHTFSKPTWWLVTAPNPFITKYVLQYIIEYCHSLLIHGWGITPWFKSNFSFLYKDHNNRVHQENNKHPNSI